MRFFPMHAVTHSLGALAIFSGVYLVQGAFTACTAARPAERRDKLFSAMTAVVCWFSGREFRDYQKLGQWDSWGFFPPVILAVLLYIAGIAFSPAATDTESARHAAQSADTAATVVLKVFPPQNVQRSAPVVAL